MSVKQAHPYKAQGRSPWCLSHRNDVRGADCGTLGKLRFSKKDSVRFYFQKILLLEAI